MQPKIINLVICVPLKQPLYVECAFLDSHTAHEWAAGHTQAELPERRYYTTEVEVLDWEDES